MVRYLRDTRERGLLLSPGEKGITVSVYIDAAYGVHHYLKSHTGSCVVIGDVGAVHYRSSKQQIIAKSSMTVYQDNLMALVERGRSRAERTRHIDIRYYWLKERVNNGEAVVKHVGTADMYANMLTKPLQGQQFVNEREAFTGWGRTTGV
jgi:hypothetical protein